MIMRKRFINHLFALCISIILIIALFACGKSKKLDAGSTWEVVETTELSNLVIADGAGIKAPEGSLLTMTVDGVETPIKAGTYEGMIVLAPTLKIGKALYNGNMTKGENVDYRTALFIDSGEIVDNSSVLSALVGGSHNNKSASDITITSDNSLFNGIIINDSDYTVSNVTMTANGAGGNDFTGYGAGIAITGRSRVEIDNFNFTGLGPIRHGIYAGGEFEDDDLTVTVNNSFLKTDGSVGDPVPGSGMSSVPWMLGIETYGHVRTQMIDGYANVTYNNSTLLSDGWGVLSTDDVGVPAKYGDFSIELMVEDSIVDITGTSGYGSYAIGASHNIFSNTVMGNTKYSSNRYGLTYALIVANEYAGGGFINGTNVTSRYGVMYHKNQTGVTRVDSSTFNTLGATFLIKHCYPVIIVSNSELNSETGVIVQLMGSDDAGMGASYYTEVLDAASIAKDKNHDIYDINKFNTTIFMFNPTELKDVVYDTQASFSDMEIKGDFYNSVTGIDDDDLHLLGQNLVLSLNNVDLTGVISSSNALHRNYSFYFSRQTDADGNKIAVNAEGYQIDGKWETKTGNLGGASTVFTPALDANGDYLTIGTIKYDLYEGVIASKNAGYLGDLVNSPAPAVNNGVIVSLTNGSVWTVTGTSYLTGLTIDNGTITAPEGNKVIMTVNGKRTEIKTGRTYTGDIVISLSKN